ncbi:hypothetical protein RPB_1950 [Rhodopseudomonas palustris HaA2]|uniref:Polymerase nucleotidyl transferase domain-containing protein n=1 Tax=Rhodopseudomonas palustris (strain HaA2) TaxID=316058 RepID=Q2IYQ2_RHOP2|nr:hypothetical protein [Rhodopseudomonas palustris]ABD06658.1 hypothetical protein RPB_1950 [Rhodopseudomonas palustris HaA2]
MRRRTRDYGPRPSTAAPRPVLLAAARDFVRAAAQIEGVRRIALIGSLVTDKPAPKDIDLLVTIDAAMDLDDLARTGRQMQGKANRVNLGGEVFLAGDDGVYLGRICHYRECHTRMLCRAQHCGARNHLNDDLHDVTLSPQLIAEPPLELWPKLIRRTELPADVEAILIAELPR